MDTGFYRCIQAYTGLYRFIQGFKGIHKERQMDTGDTEGKKIYTGL